MAKIIAVTTDEISDKISVLTQSLGIGAGLTLVIVSEPHPDYIKRIVSEELKLVIIADQKSNLPSLLDVSYSMMPPLIDSSIPFVDKRDNKPWYSRFDKKKKR